MELPTSFDTKESVLQDPLISYDIGVKMSVADINQSSDGDCCMEE